MAKVIGIAGYARCGKDTFVGIAKNILERNGYIPIRIAFADKLKDEVTRMLKTNCFQASVYTEDLAMKTLIRPLMVWWGCQRRYESDGGLYWVNETDGIMKSEVSSYDAHMPMSSKKLVFLVSDVRFVNEAKWVQESWDGVVIHLKRWSNVRQPDSQYDGTVYEDQISRKVYDPAPNEEEAKNDPLVQKLANHHIEWESKKKMTSTEAIADPDLQRVVLDALNNTKFFKHPANGTLS